MWLTDKQISDLQIIYENKFGVKLNKTEAIEIAIKLISLVKDVILPPDIEEIWKM